VFGTTSTTLATDNTVIPTETPQFISTILFFVVVVEKNGEVQVDPS
jgi:hypothetical protein